MSIKRVDTLPKHVFQRVGRVIERQFAHDKARLRVLMNELVRVMEGRRPRKHRNPAVRILIVGLVVECAKYSFSGWKRLRLNAFDAVPI